MWSLSTCNVLLFLLKYQISNNRLDFNGINSNKFRRLMNSQSHTVNPNEKLSSIRTTENHVEWKLVKSYWEKNTLRNCHSNTYHQVVCDAGSTLFHRLCGHILEFIACCGRKYCVEWDANMNFKKLRDWERGRNYICAWVQINACVLRIYHSILWNSRHIL